MSISLENSKRNQKDLPIHPELWKKKTDDEMIEHLEKCVEKYQNIIAKYEKYEDKTIHEISLIRDCKEWIGIITAA